MTRDPLQTVLRLRDMAVDTARGELAASEMALQAASRTAQQAATRIALEMQRASGIDVGDGGVEAFARWLPRGRADATQARDAADRAEAACVLARARLTASRTAQEAVAAALAKKADAAAAEAARQEQGILDEAGLRAHGAQTA